MAKRESVLDRTIKSLENKNDYVVSYEIDGKNIKIYNINGKSEKVKNTKTNISKLDKIIKTNTEKIKELTNNYDSFFLTRVIALLINFVVIICFAGLIIFSFFTGNLPLTYVCCFLFAISVLISIFICIILYREILNMKKYKAVANKEYLDN